MADCQICRRRLNQLNKPDTEDCGGDCLRCMAECDDPQCVEAMHKLEPNNPKWKQNR